MTTDSEEMLALAKKKLVEYQLEELDIKSRNESSRKPLSGLKINAHMQEQVQREIRKIEARVTKQIALAEAWEQKHTVAKQKLEDCRNSILIMEDEVRQLDIKIQLKNAILDVYERKTLLDKIRRQRERLPMLHELVELSLLSRPKQSLLVNTKIKEDDLIAKFGEPNKYMDSTHLVKRVRASRPSVTEAIKEFDKSGNSEFSKAIPETDVASILGIKLATQEDVDSDRSFGMSVKPFEDTGISTEEFSFEDFKVTDSKKTTKDKTKGEGE